MSAQTDQALADKIAKFDALFDDEDTTIEDAYKTVSDTPSAKPTHATPAPFLAADDQDDIDPERQRHEGDVVHAMQELLLRHEDTQLNRVEDPDLARVLKELRNLAHSNIADVFQCEEVMEYIGADDDDESVYKATSRLKVKDITTLPREVSACIQSIKITNKPDGDIVEVKLYDKQVSLDKLMRFHGAYVRDNEQGDNTSGVMDLLLSSIGSQGMPTIANNDA